MSSDQPPTLAEAGPSRSHGAFLELLRTAASPTTASLTPDELASSLGIADVPSRAEALRLLEKEVLAPVCDLGGDELWRWQV